MGFILQLKHIDNTICLSLEYVPVYYRNFCFGFIIRTKSQIRLYYQFAYPRHYYAILYVKPIEILMGISFAHSN